MATRVVEGKKPYTGGKAISIDENKVISLNLRDENNLIIYDSGDDEIYVDLQLPDGIQPTDAFPVGVTTGRVLVADDWDITGTIICAKTTSGDNIKILYGDDGTLWMDNGTGTFKQIYFKADVDALLLALRNYIDGELAKKQNGVSSDTAPEDPVQGDLWYDTINDELKVYDGSQWIGVGGSDIVYATQAEYNALLPGALTDNKNYFIYSTSGGGRLPAEYQEVEWIASSGTQYIDSGVAGGNGYIAEAKFIFNSISTSHDTYILGSAGSYPNYSAYIVYQDNGRWMQVVENTFIIGGSASINTEYTVKSTILTSGNSFVVNGNPIGTSTHPSSYTNGYNMYIFASNSTGTSANPADVKLYYLKIRQNDESNLIREYVPCYRIADDEIGLYDLVNDVFYTNDGTGTFTKGPDV